VIPGAEWTSIQSTAGGQYAHVTATASADGRYSFQLRVSVVS
jgi:hypothetical protein